LYEIISALRQSAIVLEVEVLELIDEDSVKLIKIKAVLKENCLLYTLQSCILKITRNTHTIARKMMVI